MRVSILPASPQEAVEYNEGMPLDAGRIRALCFDVDGTLSDTDDQYVAALRPWFRRMPFVSQDDQAARRFVMWLESPATFLVGLADRLGMDDAWIGAADWLYRHSRRRRRAMPVIPGVPEMLNALRGRFPMAVISARDERTTVEFLETAGLRSHFEVVVTALSAAHTKPYPDPVLLAARELKVDPADCLMIGDTIVDVLAGRAAGAQTVGVLCGFGEEDELRRRGADVIIASTAELGTILPA